MLVAIRHFKTIPGTTYARTNATNHIPLTAFSFLGKEYLATKTTITTSTGIN